MVKIICVQSLYCLYTERTKGAAVLLTLREMDDILRPQCRDIFNRIIDEGVSYPWDTQLTVDDFAAAFLPGEPVWCALDQNDIVLGFVHIHPNGFGRTGHIGNCGYAVDTQARGKGVGKKLVAKSIEVAREMGFKGLQFNAVVATNTAALKLYESFGFSIIGTVPDGFRFGSINNPTYVDRHIMYLEL